LDTLKTTIHCSNIQLPAKKIDTRNNTECHHWIRVTYTDQILSFKNLKNQVIPPRKHSGTLRSNTKQTTENLPPSQSQEPQNIQNNPPAMNTINLRTNDVYGHNIMELPKPGASWSNHYIAKYAGRRAYIISWMSI
jgi:hypothetical protein